MQQITDLQFAKILTKLIEDEDDCGRLIKDSTLRWLINEAIHIAAEDSITVHPEDFRIWRDWVENDPKELYRCWDQLAPGCLDDDTDSEG